MDSPAVFVSAAAGPDFIPEIVGLTALLNFGLAPTLTFTLILPDPDDFLEEAESERS